MHPWPAAKRAAVRRALLAWFDRARRDMPWRRTRDPWAILVSEVILQQTRVETGARYFGSFMAEFPTPEDLARADDDTLMRAWAGLGYYRRARNLRAAAQAIVHRHRGRLPADHAALLDLPGVGPYTAGAVASIAFDLPEPCIDGNAARVLARLVAYGRDASAPSARRSFEGFARGLIAERPGALNQALMELGARICMPRSPRCGECPVARHCAANAKGWQARLPRLPEKEQPKRVRVAVALVEADGRLLLAQNPDTGLLAGQWTLPTIETGRSPAVEALRRWLADRRIEGALEDAGPFRHAFSHRTWVGRLFRVQVRKPPAVAAPLRWVSPRESARLPLTTATRRVLERHAKAASVTVI